MERQGGVMEGKGVGSSVVNLSVLAYCSCLPIIRVPGLHHASNLYMMWLLMRLVIVPFHLSAACLHYVS